MPSPRLHRADVAHDLRRDAPVGEVDQGARRGPADAAVAHRQDRRHPALQERPIAERRADRHDRAVGGRRRAEGRSEGHAAAEEVRRTRRVWNFADQYRSAGSHRQVARVHDAGRSRRTLVAARSSTPASPRPRWVRAIEIRPSTVKGRKVTHHALARLCSTDDTDPRCSPPTRRRRRRPLHGMGGRQAGRDHAPNSGQLMLPGSKIIFGDALSRRRRGDHRSGRARHLLLSEGPGAEVSPGARLVQQHRRRRAATSTSRRTGRS